MNSVVKSLVINGFYCFVVVLKKIIIVDFYFDRY